MFDHEEIINENENGQCKSSDAEAESNKTSEQTDGGAQPQTTYGAVYVPQAGGGSYTCNRYAVGASEAKPENTNVSEGANEKKKSRKGKGKFLGAIAVALLIAIIMSGASALAAAYLTYNYYKAADTSPNAPTPPAIPGNNEIFIDRTEPLYSTQVKEPGELMTMEEAISAVKDSVVEITTERVQSGFGGYSQYVVSGAGSGVIISTGGYIITNNHVIEEASNITVRLSDGSEYSATLVATDSRTDVAVIAITPSEGVELNAATIGSSSSLTLGQTVIAIGNPLGKLGGTVTDGIISSLEREIAMEGSGTMTLLQTNAAVSPGNSGGGLFDLYGRLVGIVNAKSTGEGVEGISFAIPIDTAWNVASQLIDKGYVSGRPSLGITIKQIQFGMSFFGESYYQLVVAETDGNSELKANDIIIGIDGRDVSTLTDITDIIYEHKVGDTITVNIYRDKKKLDVEVTLREFVPQTSES